MFSKGSYILVTTSYYDNADYNTMYIQSESSEFLTYINDKGEKIVSDLSYKRESSYDLATKAEIKTYHLLTRFTHFKVLADCNISDINDEFIITKKIHEFEFTIKSVITGEILKVNLPYYLKNNMILLYRYDSINKNKKIYHKTDKFKNYFSKKPGAGE